jgi:periodic tryptophan protein 1
MSMITATSWVPRGFAAPFPTKYDFDDDEYERISKLAKLQLDDAKEELEDAQEEKKGKKGKSSSGGGGGGVNGDAQEYEGAIPCISPAKLTIH